MAAFNTYVYRALHNCCDSSNLLNELNYLQYLALSREYNPSIINKVLNKFNKLKYSACYSDFCLNPVVLHFYFAISFKISKILSRFDSKVPFKHINKFQLSSLLVLNLNNTIEA